MRDVRVFRSIVLILWAMFHIDSFSAELIVSRSGSSNRVWESYSVTIRGGIVHGDSERLKKTLKDVERDLSDSIFGVESTSIHLDSPGGDVESAMQMGRMIRGLGLKTKVLGDCASSCVLLLAAGVERTSMLELNREFSGMRPRIGIHRPYLYMAKKSDSREQLREQVGRVKVIIENYLAEMGISSQLLEMMFSLPPETIRWLNDDEARLLGLLGTDAAWDEYKTAQEAASIGLPSSVFRSKSVEAIEYCKNKHGALWVYTSCQAAYIRGLDEETVGRNNKAFQEFISSEANRGRIIKSRSVEMNNCTRIFSSGGRSC